jgi:hypothetical protein
VRTNVPYLLKGDFSLPRLHELADGALVIRVYRGGAEESGDLRIGTWQVSGKGQDFLAKRNVFHDGDHVPRSLFDEMVTLRLIWNESADLPVGRRNPVLTRSEQQSLDDAGESVLPLAYFLRLSIMDWQLEVRPDPDRFGQYDTRWIEDLRCDALRLRVENESYRGTEVFAPIRRADIAGMSIAIVPASYARMIEIEFDRFGSTMRVPLEPIAGLDPAGQLFSANGSLIGKCSESELRGWNCVLARGESVPSALPLPGNCFVQQWPPKHGWTVTRFKVRRLTKGVRRFLASVLTEVEG